MKVYLDDIRNPDPCDFDDWDKWIIVRSVESFIEVMSTGKVIHISLDHDLGYDSDLSLRRNGYDAICWLEEQVILGNIPIPDIRIHTANPSARRKMELARKCILEGARPPLSAPMFQVFDTNKPADWSGTPSLTGIPCWKNSVFETFEEAHEYMLNWLGDYGTGVILKKNEPWDYGYGSTIEIREI